MTKGRYIRTKTFITYFAKWMRIENNYLIIGGVQHEIIKTADTIEELCDCFVDTNELEINYTMTGAYLYDIYDRIHDCFVYFEDFKEKYMPLNEFDDITKIRGAIWTDKGLIYVAKMNEKGDLELI